MDGNKYYLRHPKDQLYYKTIAFAMTATGTLDTVSWPWHTLTKNLFIRAQRCFLHIGVYGASASQLVYLALNYRHHEFSSLSMMFTITTVSLALMLKFSVAQTQGYKLATTNFMHKIHLYNYYMKNREDFVKQALITAEKFSRWASYYYVILCYICWAAFEIIPIIHNFQNNESTKNITTRLEIMIHLWLPFDYEFNFYNWVAVQILMIYCGFVAISALSIFDALSLTTFFHLIGHIKILKHRLKTGFHKNLTQENIKDGLIEISLYYVNIKDNIIDLEAAYGLNVAEIYLHNLVGGGLFMYQFMTSGSDTETIMTYGLMLLIYTGILVFMSFILEDIRIKADDIPALVYDLKWEDMSVTNQKLVLMLLFQVQPTMEFNAAFNIKTGVKPAISILKTIFSYYVMINNSRL